MNVWKYEIQVVDKSTVHMPVDSKVIHVTTQYEVPFMWALVNPENNSTKRVFYVRGTGHQVDKDLIHRGSFILRGGAFVGHLFEEEL